MVKFSIFAIAMCLALAGCNKTARPAPEQNTGASQGQPATPSPSTPVAVDSNGSAANTGNLVNGPQPSTGKK